MKMKLFSIFLLCLAGFSQIQCQDNSVNLSSDYSNAFPLFVGNYWINEVTEENVDTGQVTSQQEETIRVYDKKEGYNYSVSSNVDYLFETVLKDSSGYIIRKFGYNHPLFSPKFEDTIVSNSLEVRTLVAVDSVITVPAGTFKTLVYQRTGKSDENRSIFFFANDVGMVKRIYEGKYEGGNRFIKAFELKEYHLEE